MSTLNDAPQTANKDDVCIAKLRNRELFAVSPSQFKQIPGSPIAYWISDRLRATFSLPTRLKDVARPNQALVTGKTERYVRRWHEVAASNIDFRAQSREAAKQLGRKWFPYNKGGEFRNWYGNNEHVVNWENDGHELRTTLDPLGKRIWAHNFVLDCIFKKAIIWSKITSGTPCYRLSDDCFLYDDASGVCPVDDGYEKFLQGFLASKVSLLMTKLINPTLNVQPGNLEVLPLTAKVPQVEAVVNQIMLLARADWDDFETSWNFCGQPVLRAGTKGATLEKSWEVWCAQCAASVDRMQALETENNRLFIQVYDLVGEIMPTVDRREITLAKNPAFRFKKKRKQVDFDADAGFAEEDNSDDSASNEEEQRILFRAQTTREFLSYAVGCMMGRYSLDAPGLILANAGATLEQYVAKVGKAVEDLTFSPDKDGILPVLDTDRFEDDIVARTRTFLQATFGRDTLAGNLEFIERALGRDLRKYFLSAFYKDHRQTYKNRPLYWLFVSGKQRAFQCLVYLHRYNEGTLSRMRTEYVIPLQGQIAARIEQLEGETGNVTSTSQRKKLQKEQDVLKAQQVELAPSLPTWVRQPPDRSLV